MTKFEKFAEFIMENLVYPLALTFIVMVIPVAVYFATGVELMWLVNTGVVLACITAVWLALFLVAFTGMKIIDWREEREYRKEHPNEAAYD
ncbi:MAG: hypothetical protein IJ298_08905 [Ruminococcus sp.]|nr:hypothetical protein [Ruminococcus sp.]